MPKSIFKDFLGKVKNPDFSGSHTLKCHYEGPKNDSPCPKVPGKTKKIQILKESLVTLKNPEAIRLDNQPNHEMKGAKVLFF